jgi:hypothetical protein
LKIRKISSYQSEKINSYIKEAKLRQKVLIKASQKMNLFFVFCLVLHIPSFEFRSIFNTDELELTNTSKACIVSTNLKSNCDYDLLVRHPVDCSKFLQCGAGNNIFYLYCHFF